MSSDPSSPIGRKTPPHTIHGSPGKSVIIFLTVCTKDRANWLTCADAHQRLLDIWRTADEWLIGQYLLMPDHLHLFASPARTDSLSLEKWVNFWKSRFTRSHGNDRWQWQRSFWDTRIHTNTAYTEKWQYVQ